MVFNISHLSILCLCLGALCNISSGGTVAPSLSASRNAFATDIFRVLTTTRNEENVVYSPASIQSCLTLAFLGAAGATADELRMALKLGAGPREAISYDYAVFISKNFDSKQSNGSILQMANGVFVNKNFKVNAEFDKIAVNHFDSIVERLNFEESANSVKHINDWVEQQTQHKIQNLLAEDSVNHDTSAILVNAIYFKALWQIQFSEGATRMHEFLMANDEKTNVSMMYMNDIFNYAELPELGAKVIELQYQNSDLSMLVILPQSANGLKELESKLANMDLNQIASKMQKKDVNLFLPKFEIEFEIDLKQPLKELGMGGMFENKANFSKLFETSTPQMVSDVRHKAYLNVNEAGSEAAAATFLKTMAISLNLDRKNFKADHPFVFAIRNADAVFFAGHVVKF